MAAMPMFYFVVTVVFVLNVGCILANCPVGTYPSITLIPGTSVCLKCPIQLRGCNNEPTPDRGPCRKSCATVSTTTSPTPDTTKLPKTTTNGTLISSIFITTSLPPNMLPKTTTSGTISTAINSLPPNTTKLQKPTTNDASASNSAGSPDLAVTLGVPLSLVCLLLIGGILVYYCRKRRNVRKLSTTDQETGYIQGQ